MPETLMELYFKESRREIDFQLVIDDDTSVEQVAFANLVSIKFDGEFVESMRFRDPPLIKGSLVVQFEELAMFWGAKDWCRVNLDEYGRVRASYRGALPRADPGLRQASSLLKELQSAPLSN